MDVKGFVLLVSIFLTPSLGLPPMMDSSWWGGLDIFPSLSDLFTSLFQPTTGIQMEVLGINNKTANITCSWTAPSNLTWLIDSDPVDNTNIQTEVTDDKIVSEV